MVRIRWLLRNWLVLLILVKSTEHSIVNGNIAINTEVCNEAYWIKYEKVKQLTHLKSTWKFPKHEENIRTHKTETFQTKEISCIKNDMVLLSVLYVKPHPQQCSLNMLIFTFNSVPHKGITLYQWN